MSINLFKRATLAALTMIALAVMPLQAASAYSVSEGGKQTAQAVTDCVAFDKALTAEQIAKVEADGGSVASLEGERKDAFIARLSELFGSPPPYVVSGVILVKPNGEEETSYNIGIFSESCLKGFLQLPPAVVDGLLSPNEQKPGERVD